MSEPRRSLSDRLEALRQATTSLGETATATIAAGANALFDNDLAAINAVIESDSVIDDLRHDVDNQCLEILATHSPVASDLRLVLATLRIADS
ncbi:MAG: PhoU domain-containing protein, partial [Acidimicrobiia bacterium]